MDAVPLELPVADVEVVAEAVLEAVAETVAEPVAEAVADPEAVVEIVSDTEEVIVPEGVALFEGDLV